MSDADEALAMRVLNRVLRAKRDAEAGAWQSWTKTYAEALDDIAGMCAAVYTSPVDKGAPDTL